MTDINQDNHFLCPVCQETMMIPRIYPCGHNICEECMVKNDDTQRNNSTTMAQLPIFSCPICRYETMKEWWARPVNTSLIEVLSELSEEYKKKHKHHEKLSQEKYKELTIPNNINLSYICKNMREYKANEFYKQILPILYKAAIDGKPFVTISSEHANISSVADILADKLIKQNGIYRFIANQRECQIELVSTNNHYQYSYDNPNYNTDTPLLNLSESSSEESPTQVDSLSEVNNTLNQQNSTTILQPFLNRNNQNSTNLEQERSNETNEETNEETLNALNLNPSEIINADIELVQTNQENPQVSRIAGQNGIIAVSVQNSGPNFNDRASRDISQLVVNNLLRNLNSISSLNR